MASDKEPAHKTLQKVPDFVLGPHQAPPPLFFFLRLEPASNRVPWLVGSDRVLVPAHDGLAQEISLVRSCWERSLYFESTVLPRDEPFLDNGRRASVDGTMEHGTDATRLWGIHLKTGPGVELQANKSNSKRPTLPSNQPTQP